MKRRLRTRLSTPEMLDEALRNIQDEGGEIYNILLFYGAIKGQQLDTGGGKAEFDMNPAVAFAITYGEALAKEATP